MSASHGDRSTLLSEMSRVFVVENSPPFFALTPENKITLVFQLT